MEDDKPEPRGPRLTGPLPFGNLQHVVSKYLILFMSVLSLTSCGTVDIGDNIVPPDLQLDEDFFFCRIQPEILITFSCAGGDAGEMGMCHTARSALRLVDTVEAPPPCTDGIVDGPVPDDYRQNLERVRFTIQSDALSSPFYRRPIGLDSHPRQVFEPSSDAAQLILDWINGVGP
ncbi:MAG: hypothetical protein ACFCGT_12680 [Sandaracinaceae bacterium]